ncbi:uncharacterized protein LOC112560895 [Pomacea canaliculata]|uniref:uncharacterized protein LOC112560895 n=1 Tax=Pomacea canaliculata TaxID=400727 RepID=UPI000D73D2A8|nr:uncharacterized protein LOC112560895 [Pomacea canaliculata]
MLLSRPLMFSLMHVTLVTSSVMRSTLYQRRRAMRLPSAQSYLPCQDGHCPGGRSSCVVACTSDPSCSSVNIRVLDGQCECSAASFFQFGAHVQTDGDWENYSPLDTDVTDGDWILVFRAQSDANIDNTQEDNMMAAWNTSVNSNDHLEDVPLDCFYSNKGNCQSFYRTSWLDTWPSSIIDQVRLSLYTNGAEVVKLVFNGTGSTRDNWFDRSRLLSSPWADLTSTSSAVFSLRGSNFSTFDIGTFSPNTCSYPGWLMVLSKASNWCPFASQETLGETVAYDPLYKTPQFLYAAQTQIDFNQEPYKKAEVLAIFIKLL